MSLKAKLLTALSFILLAAFLATSVINYNMTRSAVRAELLNSSLPLTGKNIYSEIHAAMMRPILVSSSMANDAFLKDWIIKGEYDVPALTKYLREIKEKYGFISTFFVSAKSDKYYYHKGVLKEINPRDPHDIWYYAFTRSGAEYDLDVDSNEADEGKLTIFVNFRMLDDNGNLLGVTGVGVNMDQAVALLAKAREEYNRDVYLIDQDGLIQVHPDKKRIERFYITKAGGIRDVAEDILQPVESARSFEYNWEGKHYLLSTRYIPEFEWHLIVQQDEQTALGTARHNLVRTLVVGLSASVLIIVICFFTVNSYQDKIEKLAKTDPLTGVANRRAFEEGFDQAAYRATRYNTPFSIIIIDLDNFKIINDEKGHLAGDEVLKTVATTIAEHVRPTDLVARWGGDEFIILMDATGEDAESLVNRINEAMARTTNASTIRFSCGISQYHEGDTISVITHRADQAMYEAKAKGGGCLVKG
ncbi:GGDEF domain-containing protein [Pseudodesulfovibrio sp. zrk46]|nr:sensor domain-containing diguanylate cyclase [Pseudodesulfovibrio sp. zrk46]QJB58416.1 GGDEF domain-containing protein [Pseudodesulfovibrio sp. zrk46]